MTAPFIHLHLHSAYSLAEGAIHPKDIVKLCQRHKMPAAAITDHHNLFGALEFANYAADEGIQPIVGCQLRMAAWQDMPGQVFSDIVAIAQNEKGYLNLMALVSDSYTAQHAAHDEQIQWQDLASHQEGLIILSGGQNGLLNQLLRGEQKDEATRFAQWMKEIFGDRFYIEIIRHGFLREDQIEPLLIDLAYEQNIPLVGSNHVFFPNAEFHEAHQALLCISAGTTIHDENHPKSSREAYFKSSDDMREVFADLPEAYENTIRIAQRCSFMPENRNPILPNFAPTPEEEAKLLREMAAAGLDERFQEKQITDDKTKEEYRARLNYELEIIIEMGFAGYFLIVADFIQWSKAEDIPVGPGRGSGAGSLVAWSLTITDLDPIEFGLLFERFLNPERVSMPDFDIDFCQDRRDEVIHYVQAKYGADRVAQIITFGKLQARAVLRDVGRVLGMPYGQVDRICKMVPNNPANPVTLAEAIESETQLQAMRDEDPEVRKLLRIALKLEGLYRHASTHAAGVVIGDRPLKELVPLYRDPRSDMMATEFNMKDVEKAGLVKFDFLGLKTLTVLQKAVALVAARGIELDLLNLPLDDPKTYELLGLGDTMSVFQLESAGMRDVLRKLKPDRFEDIIAVVALYRPGPMDNIPSFINRKHGVEKPDYLYPGLEEILEETYGVMIYQEQVMQIAQKLSGYSLGQADLLRRAMGKKIKSEMDAQRESFTEGAVAQKVPARKAGEIFDQVAKFAGYGFNKSHAAAYALIAYQTAYLKANYPVEFMAASMSYDMNNTDKLGIYRQELNRMNIRLLPPDVNKSFVEFAVEGDDAIRYALAAIKGVGAAAVQPMVEERMANGPYQSLWDLARRSDSKLINKRILESLARSGALDSLHQNRAETFHAIEAMTKLTQATLRESQTDQVSIFETLDQGAVPDPTMPSVKDWPALEKLAEEFQALGFYLSAHPLEAYGTGLKHQKIIAFAELPEALAASRSSRIKFAGVITAKKERRSAKGNKFAFVQLSDPSGVFEITVFSETLNASRSFLEVGQAVIVTADVQAEEEQYRLIAQQIEALDPEKAFRVEAMKIHLSRQESLAALQKLLEVQPASARGTMVELVIPQNGELVHITLPGSYHVTPEIRADLMLLPHIEVVEG